MKYFRKSYDGEYRYLFKGSTEYRLYKSPVKGFKYVLYAKEYDYETGVYQYINQGLFHSIESAEGYLNRRG